MSLQSWSRTSLIALATVASMLVPAGASAQATPPDQAFAIAQGLAVRSEAAVYTLTVTPSMFGCSASQAFFVHTLAITATPAQGTSGPYTLSLNVAQSKQGAAQPPTPVVFVGSSGTAAQFFSLPSVGAPVATFSLSKTAAWEGWFHIVVWGYCGSPSNVGVGTWQQSKP